MALENGDQSGANCGGQEAATRHLFRLSLALPLGQLLLSAALILIFCGPGGLMPVSAGTSYVEVTHTATDHNSANDDAEELYLERKAAEEKDNSERVGRAAAPSSQQERITGRVFASVWLLNLPGGFLQMEAARYARNHHGWIAGALGTFTSSFLCSSVLALPFWWIAGRGADALISLRRNVIAPRIRIPEAAVGFLMLAGAVLLAIAALLAFITGGDKLGALLIMMFLLLWCFLGGMTVRARYKQRHIEQPAASR
jgi:hypothetical protein